MCRSSSEARNRNNSEVCESCQTRCWGRVQDFVLEKTLGAVGFMNVASVAPRGVAGGQEGLGLGISEIQQRGAQEVTEGGVSARLYAG